MTRPGLSCACSLVLSVTAACGGGGSHTDIEASIRFADLSDVEISRLVSAATGSDAFQAQAQVLSFDDPFSDSESDCPNVVIEDRTVTLTGGCTMIDGPALEGSATLVNPFGWDIEIDFGDDQLYTFDQFAIVNSGFRSSFDGTLRIAFGYEQLEADLVADMFDMAVRSDLYFECNSSGCDIDGSGVELIGVGGAHADGEIIVQGTGTGGGMTLRGQDTVRVSFESSCISWQIEGTDRAFDPCVQ